MRVVLNDGSVYEVDDGKARVIAQGLRDSYPGVTEKDVIEELGKPEGDGRGIIGMFAYGMLEDAGLIPQV